MDEKTKNRIAKLDCQEMRTFFIMAYLDAFILVAFVYSINSPVMAWAQFSFGFLFILTFIYAGQWLMRGLVKINDDNIIHKTRLDIARLTGYLEALEDQYIDSRPASQPVKESEDKTPEVSKDYPYALHDEDYNERKEYYWFLYGLFVRGLVSENDWYNLPANDELYYLHDRPKYRQYMASAEETGLVKAPEKRGGRRELKNITFQQALDEVANHVQKTYNETYFWRDIVTSQQHTRINMRSVKTPPIPQSNVA